MVALLAHQCSARKCLLSGTYCPGRIVTDVCLGRMPRAAAYIPQPTFTYSGLPSLREGVVTAEFVLCPTTSGMSPPALPAAPPPSVLFRSR